MGPKTNLTRVKPSWRAEAHLTPQYQTRDCLSDVSDAEDLPAANFAERKLKPAHEFLFVAPKNPAYVCAYLCLHFLSNDWIFFLQMSSSHCKFCLFFTTLEISAFPLKRVPFRRDSASPYKYRRLLIRILTSIASSAAPFWYRLLLETERWGGVGFEKKRR